MQAAQDFAITACNPDGNPTGRLTGVSVDNSGIITARFSNNKTQNLGQVALANFTNEQGLQAAGGSSWTQTSTSGTALLGKPNTSSLGVIQSGALEDSNVELANELVSLILAQRNFQANAQSIKTDDTITQTIINIK